MKQLFKFFIEGIKYILTNYIFQTIIFIITFILVSVVVTKAIHLRKNVDKYESFQKNIEEKLEKNIKLEYPEEKINNEEGVSKIISCLKAPLKQEKFTEDMIKLQKSIENKMNESNYNFAMKYKDLYTGFSLSYNANQPIFGASVIKAPEAIYIYEEAEKGNINLEDTITYTSNYYSEGTGILKNTKFNVNYTIRDLVGYSIIHSDNAAHTMLNNKYKSENMYNYWKEKGTSTIFKEKSTWGAINANDSTIFMEELYNYYKSESNNKEEFINYFYKSWNIISVPDNKIKIANKTGWSDNALHDTALILDENPYVLVILTNRGYTEYESFFNYISTKTYEFHKEYWKEKIKECTN